MPHQHTEYVGYSLSEAKDALGKRKGEKREGKIWDVKPDIKMPCNELTERYWVKALPSYCLIKLNLKKFNSFFGDTIVSHIKFADLENYQAKRRKESKADATIDHEIGKTKTMVYKAFDNDLVSGDTIKVFKKAKKLLKKGTDVRDRILAPDEFDRLLNSSAMHLKGILATGYYTGMREGEILNLTWDKIDLRNRVIRLEATGIEDKEARTIPICDELHSILSAIPRAIHDNQVFLFRGKPIKDLRTALRDACSEAGISYGRFTKGGFVFHDLRHTFNTNMRKAGVPESVIMRVTGHSTREMFDRYNTVDLEDTRRAIDQMQGYLSSVDQTVDQTPEMTKKGLAAKPANP